MPHDHMAEMLDLDADVLHDFHRDVINWAGSLAPDRPRIVDLGAGSGTGTLALARHLPDARVTALDKDEDLLEHLRERAVAAGVADRVRTVRADLDLAWPDLGAPADLVWASASMHHLADPARTLAEVRTALRAGGFLVIVELDSFPRFLPDPAGAALEDRFHAELARMRHEHGMHMGEDWGVRLTAAGFEVKGERRFDIELRPPLPPRAARYAQVSLQRVRHGLADRLSSDDVAALDALATTVGDRDDLVVRATRSVWIGRRP
ncbi:class I SAM-dependent methyltransferase [Pseudonocardia humida]|uniref:Class I SAM-dependent methyltransferase n=1 Tax=Pseudonocardia humida TaxID=2800819 RepID=A0ABT1AC35_9PSEU|nr:class I SAM-dependent methyltransferase [Pseudonocardia humida]MCO1660592.1 class I SAM-dependent methyltransferase [Pseudonocardia humida]